MDQPLISFLVTAYNQESYIRAAVESALAQSYSPLEVIISDDCSKDRTFEIIRGLADAYQGPHAVKLNRNPANLGFAGHLNRAMGLCQGALVVIAAGDDVSLPTRTEAIFDAWDRSGRKATSVFSSHTTFSDAEPEGRIEGVRGAPGDSGACRFLAADLAEYMVTQKPAVNGCTHAWSNELFNFFGPLTSDLEDLVLSFRTHAIGQMLYIDRPLVRYRRHDENVSFLATGDDSRSFEHREKRLRWVDEKSVSAYDNMLADIETLRVKGRLTGAESDHLKAVARRVRKHYANERRMMDGGFFSRLATLADILAHGDASGALRASPRLLPRTVYRALYLLRRRWHSARGLARPLLFSQDKSSTPNVRP